MFTITRIKLDVWGTLVEQNVISTNVADRDEADQIIESRSDSDDPLVRYIVQ